MSKTNNNAEPNIAASDTDRSLSARAWRVRHWIAALLAFVVLYSLCGFVVAPWLLNRMAVDVARDDYGSELSIDSIRVNPWTLSLDVQGLALDDPAGKPVTTVGQIFVNFQLSSLFHWAWTFAEVRIESPEFFVARDMSGEFNVNYLFEPPATAPSTPEPDTGDLPRVLVYDFGVHDCVLQWDDRQPSRAVTTTFGPVNIDIVELNTLPQRSGEQAVLITTESSGTLSWTGMLQLNPLASSGRATVEGPHFALPSEYLQPVTGFSIPAGLSRIDFAYELHLDDAGVLHGAVDDFDLAFTDVVLRKSDPGTAPAEGTGREVLVLPRLEVSGGSVRWPERVVHVATIRAVEPAVSVYRDAEERINWIPDEAKSVPAAAEAPVAPDEPDWQAAVDTIEVQGLVFGLEDHSVEPHADIGLASLDLTMTGVSNEDGARFPLQSTMQTRGGGTIVVDGDVRVLPSVDVDWRLRAEDLALALLHPYLKPLADVNLDSGKLGFEATLQSNDENPLLLAGDAFVTDFLITETDEGSELGSWQRLDLKSFAFSMSDESLDIAEVEFDQAYADILIAEDRTVNLGRVERGIQAPPSDEPEDEPETPATGSDSAGSADEDALQIRIGRVRFEDSGADFADQSLPLPFEARIAELEGEISAIASDSKEASTVALEGKVDEHGFVRVSGTVTPLEPTLDTDMRVRFQNVEMPKFSAYSVPFAGRKIAQGRLDLDLGYQVKARKLVGENNIVLHDFELGEKVDHPGAMSLPLGLAVALLKDPSGTIDIDLPVRGDLDDPEFKYGGLVLKALANLILKIVTSPFALLGNLIGVEADEISHVDFIAGRADLTPPERERVAKLVEALGMRPQLVLELPGAINREVDGLALRQARVQGRVEERLADTTADESQFAERRREVLEALYREAGGADDPAAALEALQLEHTTTPGAADGETGEPELDTVAYAADLERRLVDAEPLGDEELAALGNARAASVRAAIIETEPALETRVVVGKPRAIEEGDESAVPMEVTLTAEGAVETVPDDATPPAAEPSD